MQTRRDEQREAFLRLSPLERMKTMHQVFMDVIALRAKSEGVTEYEIYRRYIKDDPNHNRKSSDQG